jgi:DNA-binding beta-propeller fold protein YncE
LHSGGDLVRALSVFAVLFVSLAAVSAERARSEAPGRAALADCGKNHYILNEPCALLATEVPIGYVGAVAVDPAGRVHFSSPNVVYRIDEGGYIARVAGTGRAGYAGDGGPAAEALLNFPQWYPERERDPFDWVELLGPLAFDAEGNLFIGDAYNNRVRRVDGRGVIQTVFTDTWLPQGIGVDAHGNLHVADGSGVLRRLGADGRVTPMSHNSCGAHRTLGLCAPEGIAVDETGNVFVPDIYCRVIRYGRDGGADHVAGRDSPDGRGFVFTCGYSGDGPAATAALAWPFGVAIDRAGSLFIADTYNHCVRRVDAAGMLSTIAGRCGMKGFDGDGAQARDALLNAPHGVAVDAAGTLYIADTENNRVRKVDLHGVIGTIAGNGGGGCPLVRSAYGPWDVCAGP